MPIQLHLHYQLYVKTMMASVSAHAVQALKEKLIMNLLGTHVSKIPCMYMHTTQLLYLYTRR